jgi:hypothetical protein
MSIKKTIIPSERKKTIIPSDRTIRISGDLLTVWTVGGKSHLFVKALFTSVTKESESGVDVFQHDEETYFDLGVLESPDGGVFPSGMTTSGDLIAFVSTDEWECNSDTFDGRILWMCSRIAKVDPFTIPRIDDDVFHVSGVGIYSKEIDDSRHLIINANCVWRSKNHEKSDPRSNFDVIMVVGEKTFDLGKAPDPDNIFRLGPSSTTGAANMLAESDEWACERLPCGKDKNGNYEYVWQCTRLPARK